MVKIKYVLDDGAYAPERAHRTDAGWDIRTPGFVSIPPHNSVTVYSGVHAAIPEGYYIEVCNKSGLNVKHGITLHGSGTIDSGYTGSIAVKLYNDSEEQYSFRTGDKIAQMIIHPFTDIEWEQAESLEETERGDGGFGSTGR